MNLVRFKIFLFKFPLLDKLYNSIVHRSRIKDESKFSPNFCKDDIAIVIEGFPRSCNTYFTYRFLMETRFSFKVAHHFHTPSQFYFSEKQNKKSIIVLREPLGAITSYLVRFPNVDPKIAIKLYENFYQMTLIYIKRNPDLFLAIDFERIIDGSCFAKVYDFIDYDDIDENITDEVVFENIEHRSAKLNNGIKENMIARPSGDESRALSKQKMKSKLESYQDRIDNCIKLYHQVIKMAG